LLVVDASQGIEAQTLANVYLALENNLEIIPVLNKIDLPAAQPERVAQEIEQTIGLDCSDIVRASAKAGIGIDDILERIVKSVPPPAGSTGGPFRARIFDSYYDAYRGASRLFAGWRSWLPMGQHSRCLGCTRGRHDCFGVGIQAGEIGWKRPTGRIFAWLRQECAHGVLWLVSRWRRPVRKLA
jgi:GTP-binding protein LepA